MADTALQLKLSKSYYDQISRCHGIWVCLGRLSVAMKVSFIESYMFFLLI